jgi:hypothetical protein
MLPIIIREEGPGAPGGEVRRHWGCLCNTTIGALATSLKAGTLLRELHYLNIMTSLIFTTVAKAGPLAGAVLTQSLGSKQLYGERGERRGRGEMHGVWVSVGERFGWVEGG